MLVLAQQAVQATAPAGAADSATPITELPTVTARGRAERATSDDLPAAGPGAALSGAALRSRVDATLGATLQDQLGVANASFGPNVGLPVIRGQGGARTRALIGGIATHDASTMSADHGVMMEPGLAERITVWRGPSAVRFGGGTIGGAVEVEDGRIPRQLSRHVQARSEIRADAQGQLGLVRLGGPVGPIPPGADAGWAWRADLHRRQRGDTRIPGEALDEAAVARQFGLVPARNDKHVLPDTHAESQGGALGVARVSAEGHVGAAWSRFDTDYGIPRGAHSHGGDSPAAPAVSGSGDLRIHARQSRWTAEGGHALANSSLTELKWQAVHTDYVHDEAEGPRLLTTFAQRTSEFRAELAHRLWGISSGTLGVQTQRRYFAATGFEAFVAPTVLRSAAAFSTWRIDRAPWQLDLGARLEHQQTSPLEGSFLGVPRKLPVRRFTPGSVSLAGSRSYGGQSPEDMPGGTASGKVTLTHWLAARAPDIPELYASGPHHATRTFAIGNTALDSEVLRGWDLGWKHVQGAWSADVNVFHYASGNYIYQRSLGWFYEAEEGNPQAACARLDHCLPATKYEQARARLHGYELELAWEPRQDIWRVALFSDGVRGRLQGGADLPRLPPQRWGLAFKLEQGPWRNEWRLTRARAQTRPGENETPTAGYVRVDASLRWESRLSDGRRVALFLIGRNLGDQTIRNSTSFLRNYAPEAGRVIEVGLEARL